MILTPSLPEGFLGLLAVFSALGVGVGAWALLIPTPRTASEMDSRSRSVLVRIAHGLRDYSAQARELLHPLQTDPLGVTAVVVSPAFDRVAELFHRVAGGGNQEFIDQAGWQGRYTEYRAARLGAALVGAVAGISVAVIAMLAGVHLSLPAGLVVVAVGAVSGVGVFDRWVRASLRKRQERLSEEFPTVIELLALALSAGDSLPGALQRIARRGSGELASEWARVLRMVELGEPLGPTLVQSARALGRDEIDALVDHLVQALERGAPLAEVVRAHSSDSRLRQLRAVVDRAGKAEVVMLVPLVLMILPVTVIFAVWPSLHALQGNLF
jgi:tight adherence protein C